MPNEQGYQRMKAQRDALREALDYIAVNCDSFAGGLAQDAIAKAEGIANECPQCATRHARGWAGLCPIHAKEVK